MRPMDERVLYLKKTFCFYYIIFYLLFVLQRSLKHVKWRLLSKELLWRWIGVSYLKHEISFICMSILSIMGTLQCHSWLVGPARIDTIQLDDIICLCCHCMVRALQITWIVGPSRTDNMLPRVRALQVACWRGSDHYRWHVAVGPSLTDNMLPWVRALHTTCCSGSEPHR